MLSQRRPSHPNVSVDADRNAACHDCAEKPAAELPIPKVIVEEAVEGHVRRAPEDALGVADVKARHQGVEVDEQRQAHADRQRGQLLLQLGHLLVVAEANAPTLVEENRAHPLDVVSANLGVEDEAGPVRGAELAPHDLVAIPVHAAAAQGGVEHHADGRELHSRPTVAEAASPRPRGLGEDVAVLGDHADCLRGPVPTAGPELAAFALGELRVVVGHREARGHVPVARQLIPVVLPVGRRRRYLHGLVVRVGRAPGLQRRLQARASDGRIGWPQPWIWEATGEPRGRVRRRERVAHAAAERLARLPLLAACTSLRRRVHHAERLLHCRHLAARRGQARGLADANIGGRQGLLDGGGPRDRHLRAAGGSCVQALWGRAGSVKTA
mmetsp:Transcript_105224/g.297779  ORF Transcript_105224/g.297779 Transcript_105224/m.297779 type:complete len:384 (-) Transcript_105224:29-1180(-)